MAGEISKLPLGLLGFLGIKNGGAYPRSLGVNYDPSLDLLPLLIGANFDEANPALIAAPATGNAGSYSAAGITVPQTEVWAVMLHSARVTTGAGEAFNGFLALRRFPVTSPNVVHALTGLVSIGASAGNVPLVMQLTTPLWLGPGDELVIFSSLTTGAPQVRGHARFARFPI